VAELRTLKAQYAVEFIDIEKAAQVADVNWEAFQIEYLNISDKFSIDVKSRQIAWSFTSAVDAIADGMIHPGNPHVFVSINLDEAREKIRYCKAIIEAMDQPVRPRLVTDSKTELEFDNGSRFISHPCKPPRGKPQARIYLDEMAHYPNGLDRTIYTAALPATTKGDGYIRIGSSPLGAKGLFWEIVTESTRKFPGFVRRFIPWWEVQAFCTDLAMAKQIAQEMLTTERVRAFGTPAIQQIFENMFLEDFQQEYECAWIDEATAWITWEVIQRNQSEKHLWWHARSTDEALVMVDHVLKAMRDGRIEPVMVGGIDIGRSRDLTEFMLLGRSTTGQLPLRFSVSLANTKFDDQQNCLSEIIKKLPITSVLVDRNGLGMQLAENLARLTGKAQGFDFTNPGKELLAVESRLNAEASIVPLPMDRDIAYQIHSIKKTVTAAKNNVYDTERNEKHHADKYWAWALAQYAAHTEITWPESDGLGTVEEYESRWK
jgi:phage FluMu gp28-like protein